MLNACYFAALIFIINFIPGKSDKALLFDLDHNSLVQKEVRIFSPKDETICHNCAIACPASDLEKIIYNPYSVGKRVLLVKKIYGVTETIDKIELPECEDEEPIRPSTVLNKSSGLIEIGYEIHDPNNIVDFRNSISKTDEFLSVMLPTFMLELRRRFIWLPVLLIDLDVGTLSPIRIEYNSGLGIHQPRGDCNEFDEEQAFFPQKAPYSFYSHENQRLLFTGKKDLKVALDEGGLLCGQNYGCLVQHQIIPSYYMHSYLGALAACTYMNTTPIWEDIIERIKNIDKYLYAMSQIWESNIKITNGFFGIFKATRKHFEKVGFFGKKLFLDQTNNNVPVPEIFYKIVEYKINDALPQGTTYYYAVIVIHNDPTSSAGKRRICEKEETVEGWEDVQNSDLESGLTYVCAFNNNVTEKLNLFKKENVDYENSLKLDNFPNYDVQQRKYFYQDERSKIRDKIKDLF